MEKIKEKIKKIWERIQTKWKLRRMDEIWRFYGGNCFGLNPPSFYYTHTKEEIERIEREEIAELKKMIEEYSKRNESQA